MPGDVLLEPSKHKFDCPKCSKQGYVSQSCYFNDPPTGSDKHLHLYEEKVKSALESTIQTIEAPSTPSTINPCQAINPHNKQNYFTIIRNNRFTVNITQ